MPGYCNLQFIQLIDVSRIKLLCLIKRRSRYTISSELSLARLMLIYCSYDKHRVHSARETRRTSSVVQEHPNPLSGSGWRNYSGCFSHISWLGFAALEIIFGQHITAAADGFFIRLRRRWAFRGCFSRLVDWWTCS